MPFFHFPAVKDDRQNRFYTIPTLVAILVFAAVLRFAYLVEIQANPMPVQVSRSPIFDQYNYVTMAADIVKHHWLGSQHPGHSPVYSYFIAAIYSIFGADMNVIFVVQILYGILAVYLFYRCATLLFNNKNLGLLAAFVAAHYSPFIFYECALLRESLIGYTNLLALYFFLLALRKGKTKNYLLAGVATGLSFILRAGIFPVFLLAYMVLRKGNLRDRGRRLACVLLGMAIVITPLTIRNYVSGFKALTETSGPSLFWIGNSYDSPGIDLAYTKTQERLTAETQGRIWKTMTVLAREIRQHPREYAELYARKFRMLFNGYEILANLSYDLFKENSWVLKLAVFNFVLVSPLALLGLILFFRKYNNLGILYLFIFSLSAFVFMFHIQSRYRIAFIPFYVLAASYTLFWFWQMIRLKELKPLGAALIMLIPVFVFTYPNREMLDYYYNGGIRAGDYANMASAYLMRVVNNKIAGTEKTQYLEKALQYYDRALPGSSGDDQVSIYITKAMVYRDLYLKVHAIDALTKALAINPKHPIANREYQRLLNESF